MDMITPVVVRLHQESATEAHKAPTKVSWMYFDMFIFLVACGRTMFRENSGLINSPNYPGNYPNNIRCIYTIHRYSSAPTQLQSIAFNLEYRELCGYDYVKVGLEHRVTKPK